MSIAMSRSAKSAVTTVPRLCRSPAGSLVAAAAAAAAKKAPNNILTETLMSRCRCGFMYGELTDKETVSRLEYTLENQQQDQFEILLYKKNSKYHLWVYIERRKREREKGSNYLKESEANAIAVKSSFDTLH